MNRREENIEEKIELQLKREIDAAKPDMLESLMNECGLSVTETAGDRLLENVLPDRIPEDVLPEKGRAGSHLRRPSRSRVYRFLRSVAAVLFCAVIAASAYRIGLLRGAATSEPTATSDPTATSEPTATSDPVATVSFDANPSIELAVDASERVITCTAVNEDGKEILHGLDLAGTDLHVAAYAIVGAIVTEGYLTDDVNGLLISVMAQDDAAGRALEEKLASELSGFLRRSEVHAAVFGQHAADSAEVRSFAEESGISCGRAALIRSLLARNPRMTEASLLALSTQELLVLWEKRAPAAETPDGTETIDIILGSASTSGFLPQEEAAAAAFAYAGVEAGSAENVRIEFDCEDGFIVYEVEFSAGGLSYEIDVNARDGKVVNAETEDRQEENDADPDDDDLDDDDSDDDDDFDDDSDDRDLDDDDRDGD